MHIVVLLFGLVHLLDSGGNLVTNGIFVEYSLHHYGIRILTILTVVIFIVWFYLKKQKKTLVYLFFLIKITYLSSIMMPIIAITF